MKIPLLLLTLCLPLAVHAADFDITKFGATPDDANPLTPRRRSPV